jgi:hypothetical protein
VTDEGEERLGHHLVLKQMIMLMDLLNIIANAAGQALRYSAHHHWFFGFVLFCYSSAFTTEAFMSDSARWTSESTRSGSVSPAISDAMRAYGLSISIDLLR